jgi:hypothetical protein
VLCGRCCIICSSNCSTITPECHHGCSLFQTTGYLQHRDTNNNCLPSITRKPCYDVTRVSERGLLCYIIACGRKACNIARAVIYCLITSTEHVPLSSKCDRSEDKLVVFNQFSFTISLNLCTFSIVVSSWAI